MKIFVNLLIACIVSVSLQAQIVKGKVTDEEGQPLADASVTILGSFNGTVTNATGHYSLPITKPGVYTVEVNHVGYQPLQKTITAGTGETELSASLSKTVGSLQEVTVTAGRKPEIVNRTPASVQVINSRDIQTQMLISPNIANVLAQAAPAIAFGSNTTSNVGQTLRGRTPLIMVDGIPQSTPLRAGGRDIRTIDPASIERIEVVKGATAIYGNGADGGVINYITKKSASAKPFNASTYLANTGMLAHTSNTLGGRISQQFNGQVKSFDYVINGSYEKTGVNKDAKGVALSPVYGLGESNIYNVFTKLGYNLSSQHRIEGMYNYFGSAQNSDYIEQMGVYGTTPTIGIKGDRPGEQEGTRYNHNAYVKYAGKDLFLSTNVEASAYLQSFYTVYGWTAYFQDGGQSTLISDKKGLRLNLNTPYRVSDWFTGDVVYGVDLARDVTSQKLTDGRIWVPEIEMNNNAPYLQANATLFKNWLFKAGYRYDDIHISVPSFTQIMAANGAGGNEVTGGDMDFNASTFNTGLRFARYDLFKPFVSYTQGFSIIDVGRYVRAATEDDIARMDIKPVKVDNYEFGFNSSHKYFEITGSYFISKNKIGASLIEENGWYVQQKAPEKTYGYEFALDAKPLSFLHFGGAYVYVEGKADINKNDAFDDEGDMYLNGTKIAPPKTTAYLRVMPTKALNFYMQWLHFGDRNRFAPRTNGTYAYGNGPVESEGIVNFSGSWQASSKISLSLGIENLFNKDYFTPIAQWSAQNGDYIKANGIRYQLGVGIKW
ncbi:MAG TPA: TonB-dependent receptor [Chitinophagaceae bacterium]